LNKIAIVGASGHGKVVADLAGLCGFDVAFFDDAYPKNKNIEHWPIIGDFNDLLKASGEFKYAIVAIGNNNTRTRLSKRLIDCGLCLPVLIHPKSCVSQYAKIGEGSVVFANAVINAFARIGSYSIINSSAIVEHDCTLGEGVHLSPNVALAGGTIIHSNAWLGIGTVTRQLIEIGRSSVIGANSTVIKNIPADVTAFGSPAVIKDSFKC
jgi:sugar O-acyltransferase (sialic acid O-acetyltransferase NeuD family)